MATIAISMIKNGIDIIEPVLKHLATQVDHIIVSDNESTDGSRELLMELSKTLPLSVLDDYEKGFFQSRKMTSLAKVARNMGADWVIPVDQDEIWYSPFGTIKEVLESLAPQWLVASADLYDHVTSSRDDMLEENPIKRIGWRRSYKGALPKVACRWREDLIIEQGNHSAHYDGRATYQEGLLVVRHYPYRSTTQFINKVKDGVAAYAATDLPESSGAHWKDYGRILTSMGEEGLELVYNTWFHLDNPASLTDVIYDPAPVVLQ